ncbi:MAG: hypothetical protein ACT6Q8_24590 [Niveispirillum sp.]|uniref:hypothetical protein n=1 Tax=Niveispirillum sp. TaxID=1917217 RepID=UPI0040370202
MRIRNILASLSLLLSLPVAAAPADDFLASLRPHCGKAFEGIITTNESGAANDPFAGQRLVMHVRDCSKSGEVRIPLHVGEDRSRTWIVTRTATGLRLKHDHRHADGTEDKLTQYGGDTIAPGTAGRQSFPADAFSRTLFTDNKLPPGAQQNVWTLEQGQGTFTYELARPGRVVRMVFDLTKPVAAPPAPWGHE